MEIGPDRVPALQCVRNAVVARVIFLLIFEGAEHAIPQYKYAPIVLVDIVGVLCVVHAMIGGCNKHPFDGTESSNVLSVYPELIDQVEAADRDHHFNRQTGKIERNIKDKANVVGAGLSERSAEIEFFALMMSHMRRP